MLGSLNSAVSGLQQFQQELNVIGNNIANVGTTAYKGATTAFEDNFSQALAGNMQVGTGVGLAAVSTDFSQGGSKATGAISNLLIDGQGFFSVRDSEDGTQFVTRDGDFTRDANGYLTTKDGLRLQGYSDSGLSTIGDIQIDATGAPSTAAANATFDGYSIADDGTITVVLSDGTEFTRGQILLQGFRDTTQLTKEGSNLYSYTSAAGPLSQLSAPQTNGLGKVVSGSLETANVDLTEEMSGLITAQRAFQANARVLTTSDEVLQELVNLKR